MFIILTFYGDKNDIFLVAVNSNIVVYGYPGI